ncbi:MAG: MFS transporter [Planctomycetes bacterium]|nr:MFS transporter [Planctomycetota bacterium]
MADSIEAPAPKLTMTQWLVCLVAAIGFAFDIYELLMAPLVFPPAITELTGYAPGSPEFLGMVKNLIFIPAIAGSIFGLLGGYLTDVLGRRRVLTFSILLYAFSAFFAGFSTSIGMLMVLRCTTFIGVCVEFVAAVAWLAELFPHPKQREKVLGYTQAFSSVGGLFIATVYGLMVNHGQSLPGIGIPEFLNLGSIDPVNQHAAWRYTLMSGLVPAIPLIVIRPFLPESPLWKAKKDAGTLKRPSFLELFKPQLCKTTIITTIMFACSYGAAFGAIQQIPQIVPGMAEVKTRAADASAEVKEKLKDKPEKEVEKAAKIAGIKAVQSTAADVTKVQEVGGLVGRVILAVLAVWIVSRRKLIRVFLIPGLLVMPLVFGYAAVNDLNLLYVGMFLAGMLTVGQLSFWGNYLPRVYPLHLRGTGESFAANIGGRLIGTSFAYVTATLAAMDWVPGTGPAKVAYVAAGVGFTVYFVNLICSFFLPEPGAGEPEDA